MSLALFPLVDFSLSKQKFLQATALPPGENSQVLPALKNRKCFKIKPIVRLSGSFCSGWEMGKQGRRGGESHSFKGLSIWKGQCMGVFGKPWAQEM